MATRELQFEHDGHRFTAAERIAPTYEGGEQRVRWEVTMDGERCVLEFQGAFPFDDSDVRKRVLEWYEIQKPRT